MFHLEKESERNKLIGYLLLYTGIRVSELVSMQITDIDQLISQLTVKRKRGKLRDFAGASKSTSMRMTRQIIDPDVQDLLTMPNSMQDLALSIANNYMPIFDNLDNLSSQKSDLLCIASTGGAFSKRTLFTDDDETLLDIKRCVGMNGINVVVTKADLLDRSILIELDRIDC